jgi:hypothetical protein
MTIPLDFPAALSEGLRLILPDYPVLGGRILLALDDLDVHSLQQEASCLGATPRECPQPVVTLDLRVMSSRTLITALVEATRLYVTLKTTERDSEGLERHDAQQGVVWARQLVIVIAGEVERRRRLEQDANFN